MTDQRLKKQLETLNVPDINVPNHANLLKADLLRRHNKTLGLLGGLHYVKSTYTQMSLLKKLSPIAAVVVIAVIFGVLNQSPTANAQAAVNKAMVKAQKLTPEQRANIENKIKADLNQSLEEAKAASDLKIESGDTSNFGFGKISDSVGKVKDFFINKTDAPSSGAPVGIAFRSSENGETPVSQNIKTMTYTNPKGQKVTLGVDENDMVVFKMVELTEAQRQEMMEKASQIEPGAKGFSSVKGEGDELFEIGVPPNDMFTIPQ